MKRAVLKLCLLLSLGLAILGTTGCKTANDDQNMSERPWNAPKGWEHGLPTGMYENR